MVKEKLLPNTIDGICELFGECQLLVDPFFDYRNRKTSNRYYLGEPGDRSVGIWPYELTPIFRSQKALERYCKSTKGRIAINKLAGEIFPDWDVDKMEWKR